MPGYLRNVWVSGKFPKYMGIWEISQITGYLGNFQNIWVSVNAVVTSIIRDEMREIRQSLVSSRHVTEGLRSLVINLSEQVSNNSMTL